MKKLGLLLLILLPFSLNAAPPSSFTRAKKIASTIFHGHRQTLYCQCQYDDKHHIDLASCNMGTVRNHKRANYMEWEHMVPASMLAGHARCWTEDMCTHHDGRKYHGRRCCRIINKEFRAKEAELFNLWPANGLINQIRSNYHYANVPYGASETGCNFYVDNDFHRVEPNDNAKGVAARASLFMAERYQVRFSQDELAMFTTWNMLYPPKPWEVEWASQVESYEGYSNHYIIDHS